MDSTQTPSAECCPQFNPEGWDGKTWIWQDKLFMQDNVRALFHIPLNMGTVIPRMWNQIQGAQAAVPTKDFVMLACDPTPWKTELYFNVTKDVPGAKMVRLSGTYVTRVFDGPYRDAPKWLKQTEQYLAGQNKKASKYYFYYTTCPKCAKKYGHNYVVVFAQVA
ncbi:MAG: hypothetical protein JXB18_01725 [Sedimentisphaerales bacterium]|nr:hypothetical protein [Sedimentisphaerales bacterium]